MFRPSRQQFSLPCLLLVALLVFAFDSSAEVAVVTHAGSPLASLNQQQVSDVFLGRVYSLPDGNATTIIDQADASPLREEFYLKIANKTAAQAKALWAKLYFTGRAVLPLQGEDDAEVKKLVSSTPGAIGYIRPASLDPSVKLLYIAP